jgi:hypothetical protein
MAMKKEKIAHKPHRRSKSKAVRPASPMRASTRRVKHA